MPRKPMLSFQETYERICEVTGARTQVELANLLAIRQSSISDAKRRNSIPADWYMKLFEKLGINPNWLKYGIGSRYLNSQSAADTPAADNVLNEAGAVFGNPQARSFVKTVYGMACPAGTDTDLSNLSVEGHIPLLPSYTGKNILVFLVDSEAFAPTVFKGAHVGIDTAQRNPVSGGLYAMHMPYGGITLRRLYLDINKGGFILRVDSQKYPETFLTAAQCRERLLGKVVWVMHHLLDSGTDAI